MNLAGAAALLVSALAGIVLLSAESASAEPAVGRAREQDRLISRLYKQHLHRTPVGDDDEGDEDDFVHKRADSYSPWTGKRSTGYSPWTGKRSAPSSSDDDDEPRRPKKFLPWVGKRAEVDPKRNGDNYNWDRMRRSEYAWDRMKKAQYAWDRMKKDNQFAWDRMKKSRDVDQLDDLDDEFFGYNPRRHFDGKRNSAQWERMN